MLGGVAPAGSSARIATSCSRKSGLPSAAARISSRRTRAPRRPASPRSRRAESVPDSGRRRTRRTAAERRVPPGPALQEIVAGEADDRHRRRGDVARQVLDQVEQRRLGPVDVVEHHHHRRRPGQRLEHPAHRPLDVLRRRGRVRPADRARHHRRRELVLLVAGHQLGQGLGAAEVVDDVLQRPVGDALAVGQAAADDDPRVPLEVGEELPCQPRLADPGRPEHRGDDAPPLLDRRGRIVGAGCRARGACRPSRPPARPAATRGRGRAPRPARCASGRSFPAARGRHAGAGGRARPRAGGCPGRSAPRPSAPPPAASRRRSPRRRRRAPGRPQARR